MALPAAAAAAARLTEPAGRGRQAKASLAARGQVWPATQAAAEAAGLRLARTPPAPTPRRSAARVAMGSRWRRWAGGLPWTWAPLRRSAAAAAVEPLPVQQSAQA